jgi:hypothetical protein
VEQTRIYENELRAEIYDLQYGQKNQAVKPTGKLRFLSAYRFYRREQVPTVKQLHPEMEGKSRH